MDPRTLLGQRLRILRKERGLSQEDLALEAGLDRTYVSGIERGERNVALVNICKLATALGVRPSFLFEFEWRNEADAARLDGAQSDEYQLTLDMPAD